MQDMDEHHEELKGPKAAWATASRRSVSWLVYLNDVSTTYYNNNNNY
jgi:hypothetical protein